MLTTTNHVPYTVQQTPKGQYLTLFPIQHIHNGKALIKASDEVRQMYPDALLAVEPTVCVRTNEALIAQTDRDVFVFMLNRLPEQLLVTARIQAVYGSGRAVHMGKLPDAFCPELTLFRRYEEPIRAEQRGTTTIGEVFDTYQFSFPPTRWTVLGFVASAGIVLAALYKFYHS
ncbi:hypothetical protein FAES_3272 [Fibrella aestuarina BUZ 2]|uniref:Uncharacterized protein n=1 Tax=Fibrella aestuarina BUZ 2 TaxID=1166018 RepID=I0KAX8_9BACT|nr:hypothetical protein [Fibrella aestuarina]CCH01281.1 hypothetical protein FAES_3272 [Fibrella aestuarina BUZ 2]